MTNNTVSAYNFEAAKAEYRAFCEAGNHDIQVFALPWYLDAVCDNPDDWRVILYKEGNKVVAAFPFSYTKNKSGWWTIQNPWQSKRLGFWIDYSGKTQGHKKEAFENEVVQFVIDNLPLFDVFHIDFDARFTNWRVFYNNGFSQQTSYSYVVRKEQMEGDYYSTIAKHKKKDIKTLQSLLVIDEIDNFDDYWSFFEKSYELRGRTSSYTRDQAERLITAAQGHGAIKIYAAKNQEGQITGVSVIFFDSRRSYCMFGTFDPTIKISPRVLLTYQSILDMTGKGLDYDFEGSMIPGVAQYDMEFNPEREPYFNITKQSDRVKLKTSFIQLTSLLKKKILGKQNS